MKKIAKHILNIFLGFNLIVLPAFGSTTTGPAVEERTLDKIDTFLKSGEPSDIPFIDYMDSFTNESSQPLKQFDLGQYKGKRVFVGYGIYDKDQNFCKYVEKPGMEDPSLYFQNISTFNKHSYAISLTTMNYDTCVELANKFNGIPVSITSAPENSFVSSKYGGKSKWLGIQRPSCSEEYLNKEGKKQEYFNWSSISETGNQCVESELNVVQNRYGTWNKKDKLELNHCLIEVDTEDINRPIKVCAPWWRIEREYAKDKETTFYGVDVYKINQADIPEQFNVCTKYEEKALADSLDKPNREVTCTSYYDTMIAPECLRNPYQDICKVDECNGYIKNACRMVDTLSGFKDYTKAEGILSGTNTIMKGKVDIKTHVYDCPASLPSLSNCEEQSNVIIFPKECPNSDCDGYKKCVQEATTIEEKDACASTHVCEKIYGNPDNVEFNADGTLRVLKNTCSDGTVLEFTPSIQDKLSKKCLEYDEYIVTEDVSQKCTLERPFTDHRVDTSITENDIYMNNPQCIRLNNVVDARPTVQVMFKYQNNGWAQTVIKKSYLDGEQNVNVQDGTDTDMVDAAMNAIDPFADIQAVASSNAINSTRNVDCSAYSEGWVSRNNSVLNNPVVLNNKSYLASSIANDNGTDLYAKYLTVPDSNTCNNISSSIGGISTNYNSTIKVCKVFLNKYSGDLFSLIKGNGSMQSYPSETVTTFNNIASDADCLSKQVDANGTSYFYDTSTKVCSIYTDDNTNKINAYTDYTYITNKAIDKKSCDEIAYCLNGAYNESAYSSAALSQCQVTSGDNYEYEDKPVLQAIDSPTGTSTHDENCVPLKTNGSYLSQLDGTQDIFSVQEVVTGDFGYYSNYNSHPFVDNLVKINDKQVFPIKGFPIIEDPLIYEGTFTQTSILTKKPNIVAGSMGGAAAGAASYAYLSQLGQIALSAGPIGWIIAIVIVVFVIVTMIFGKKQKFNEQRFSWIIYKLVPQERYITNIYGYDHRIVTLNDDGTVYIDSKNRLKLVYARLNGFTGTLKPGDFKNMLNNLYVQKEVLLTCMGWFKSDVVNISHSAEKSVIVDYPKCKSFSWSCNKKKTRTYSQKRDPFFKRMANNYIGAVNGLSIIVPYLGEYELKAYDQHDNLLGSTIIKEKDFLESTSDVAKYAQVMFGLDMDLADGITEGTRKNACRFDLMAEWGGGTSGIYFENNDTGQNQDCQKSHDAYVQNNSATKITIRPLNMDRAHVIELVKPMPYANKIFLVTLNEKEIREYRCYDEFSNCDNNSFSSINEN